jgi:hypothetical protein
VVDVLATERAVVAQAIAAGAGVSDDAIDHVDGGAGLTSIALARRHGLNVEDHPVIAEGVGTGRNHGELSALPEFGVAIAVLDLDTGMHVAPTVFGPPVGGGLAHRRGHDGAITDDVLPTGRVRVRHRGGRIEAV